MLHHNNTMGHRTHCDLWCETSGSVISSSFKDPDYTVLCQWSLMVRATRKAHSGYLQVLGNIPLSMNALVHFLIGVLSFRRHHYKLFDQKLEHQLCEKSQVLKPISSRDFEPPITSASFEIHLNEVVCQDLHHGVEYKLDWSPIQQSKYERWELISKTASASGLSNKMEPTQSMQMHRGDVFPCNYSLGEMILKSESWFSWICWKQHFIMPCIKLHTVVILWSPRRRFD